MMYAFQLFVILAVFIGCGHGDSEFTYYGTMGPDHWSEHYNQCAGKHQSPIDINDLDVIEKEYSEIVYENFDKMPFNASMTNNGHTVLVTLVYDGDAPLISNGPLEGKGKYEFQQLHFHWGEDNSVGSEDRINNVSFPMELHIVFRNTKYVDFMEASLRDDGVAVMAFFYEISENMDRDYDSFTSYLQNIHEPQSATRLEPITLFALMPEHNVNYYSYIGSLTTPPCSEDVIWIDYSEPISISSSLLERFRALKTFDGSSLSHNFRPVQPLNNRKINGNMDQAYNTFFGSLKNITEPQSSTSMEIISLLHLMPEMFSDYYTYIGSMTMPPCIGDVILMEFIAISPTVIADHVNNFFDYFTDFLTNIREPQSSTKMESLNLKGFLPDFIHSYFIYSGSIGTASCSETVIWMQFIRPIRIASKLVERFRYLKAVDGSQLSHRFSTMHRPANGGPVYRAVRQKFIPVIDAFEDGAMVISCSCYLALLALVLHACII